MDPLKKKRLLKHLLCHGAIISVALIGGYFYLPVLMLLNIGYFLYFAVLTVRKVVNDQEGSFARILSGFLMTLAMVPCGMICLIPSWFIGVCHTNKAPEIRFQVKEYQLHPKVILRDASTFRNYNSFLYEGKISEKEMHTLACLRNWTLHEIQRPVRLDEWAEKEIRCFRKQSVPHEIIVKKGLYYYQVGKRGSGTHIVWDRESGILYGCSHLR